MIQSWPREVVPIKFCQNMSLSIDPKQNITGLFWPFTLGENCYLEIVAQKRPGAQDQSLRFWISERPWGETPNNQFPTNDKDFAITNSGLKLRIGFFQPSLSPIQSKYRYIKLIPGSYYANVQNLENRVNRFRVISCFKR